VEIRALSWNLFHGRDFPPNEALFTWRSRLLRVPERDTAHVQVNRDLLEEFAAVLSKAEWDVALLQECPPRWSEPLAAACDADAHRSLTSRNSLALHRSALGRWNPDLLGSWEGGSNLTLVRAPLRQAALAERRELELRRRPERRTMAFTRLSVLCVANLHASTTDSLAVGDVRRAAEAADRWAGEAPLLFGGDLNQRPARDREVFDLLEQRFDLAPCRARVLDEMATQDIVGEIELQVGEIPKKRFGRRRKIRHAGRIRAYRCERAGMRGAQLGEDRTGASGEARGQRHHQVAFAAEALHQQPRRDAGLAGNIGEGKLVRTAPTHGTLGGREYVLVGNLLGASSHTN
jgi:endonuclease/exonuclease/phosphatase family metal-dependent hydrolase